MINCNISEVWKQELAIIAERKVKELREQRAIKLADKHMKQRVDCEAAGWLFKTEGWKDGHNGDENTDHLFRSPRMSAGWASYEPLNSDLIYREAEVMAQRALSLFTDTRNAIDKNAKDCLMKFYLENPKLTQAPDLDIRVSVADTPKYLVVNNGKSASLSYSDQYQLFDDRDEAIKHFQSIGGTDQWGLGYSNKPGVATIQMSGDVNIMLIPILTQ